MEMIAAAWRWLARLALCDLPVRAVARAALADYQGQRPESAALCLASRQKCRVCGKKKNTKWHKNESENSCQVIGLQKEFK